jgi:hypothetical protein
VNVPFAFAKRHGVLVDAASDGAAVVLYTHDTPPVVLQERPFTIWRSSSGAANWQATPMRCRTPV